MYPDLNLIDRIEWVSLDTRPVSLRYFAFERDFLQGYTTRLTYLDARYREISYALSVSLLGVSVLGLLMIYLI